MGGSAGLLADCARELIAKGAPRVDLNCGCPAKCVTGKGAGSSLLKDPELVYKCVVSGCITKLACVQICE
jgi:tRNA-dihydrouridine synthase C